MAEYSRAVGFDFDLTTEARRRNSLHKVDIMIETLVSFRDALHAEAELARARS